MAEDLVDSSFINFFVSYDEMLVSAESFESFDYSLLPHYAHCDDGFCGKVQYIIAVVSRSPCTVQ